MSIGQRLRMFKKLARLKNEELADLLGVSKTMVTHYFNDKSSPPVESIINIKRKYPNFNTDWLLQGIGDT